MLLLLALVASIAACGDSDNGPVTPTASPTPVADHTATRIVAIATAPPTATASSVPTATATVTATCIRPTLTATPSRSATVTATATPTRTPEGPIAFFDADPLNPANPFPSDRLLDATGHVHVSGPLIGADLPPGEQFDTARNLSEVVATQLAMLTGFSTYAPIRVKLDRSVTVGDLAPGDVTLLQLDTLTEAAVTVTAVTPEISGDDAIEIQPVVPLKPKTRYVYAVSRAAARDERGNALVPSAGLTAALDGGAATTATWHATLAPALDALQERFGITPVELAAIEFFTTQATTDDLESIRNLFDTGVLAAQPPLFTNSPIRGLTTGVFPEGTPEFTSVMGATTSTNVAAVAIGVFDSYDFRTDPNGFFDPAKVRGDVTPSTNHLDFYMTIPKAPPPPGGYPIVIFGHGLGGSGRDVTFVSRLIGDAPLIAIAISDVEHGRRGNIVTFFVLSNGFITRERFRQTVADYVQLARMIVRGHGEQIAPFDQVNPDRIEYMGVSLGGIMGTLFLGIDPLVKVGMLSVPGGGLPQIINSKGIGDLLKPLISATSGIPIDDPLFPVFLYRFFQLSQWFIDPADPINTAPYIVAPGRQLAGVPPKRVLMHEGVIDDIVPNVTTDALALAMGLPDAKATRGCASPDGCSGIWRFVMTEYGFDEFTGHSATGLIPQAGAQAGHFLATFGEEIRDASLQVGSRQ